ncbi:MAG: flotillin-like FloA family protein [Pirellulales bacterium]
MEGPQLLFLSAIAAMAFFAIILVGVSGLFLMRPWLRAAASGAPVSMMSILGMRLRGNPPEMLIDAYIALKRAGVNANISGVEGVYIDSRTRVRSRDDLIALVKSKLESDE